MNRRYVNAPMPPGRDDGLLHHVEQSAHRWECLPDCESCLAAGEFLHGPAGPRGVPVESSLLGYVKCDRCGEQIPVGVRSKTTKTADGVALEISPDESDLHMHEWSHQEGFQA